MRFSSNVEEKIQKQWRRWAMMNRGCYEMTIAWHYMKGEYCEYWLISESYYCEPRCRWPWGNESLRHVVDSELPLAVFLLGHYNRLKSTDEEITRQNSCLTSWSAEALKAWIQRAKKAYVVNFKLRRNWNSTSATSGSAYCSGYQQEKNAPCKARTCDLKVMSPAY